VADITPNNATTLANATAPLISAYSINAPTGELSQVAGSPFVVSLPQPNCCGYFASAFAVDPVNSLLYVGFTDGTPFTGGTVSVESINTLTGAIAPVAGSPFATGGGPSVGSFAIDAVGQFLYAADPDADLVLGFSISGPSGNLTAISNILPAAGGVSSNPQVVSVDPSGHFLYATNTYAPFTINVTTGTLKPNPNGAHAAIPMVFSTIP